MLGPAAAAAAAAAAVVLSPECFAPLLRWREDIEVIESVVLES